MEAQLGKITVHFHWRNILNIQMQFSCFVVIQQLVYPALLEDTPAASVGGVYGHVCLILLAPHWSTLIMLIPIWYHSMCFIIKCYLSVVQLHVILHGNAAVSLVGSRIGQRQLTAPSTHIIYLPNYYHQVSGEWRLCCSVRRRRESIFVCTEKLGASLPACLHRHSTILKDKKTILSEDRGRIFICRIHLCSV